jgi:RNA polymerase sigma factor (sigma-70 family)
MTATTSPPRPDRLDRTDIARLVHAAAAGDTRSWNVLVREFSGMLRAVARSHRLSEPDTADVVQGTWLRLMEHVDDLTAPSQVGAWLATTARRECWRILGGARRSVPFGDDAPESESNEPLPEERLLTDDRNRALWRAFSRLRPMDQTLLRLLLADPRPAYEEISAALRLPIGSIGPTRRRALDRLRRELMLEGVIA